MESKCLRLKSPFFCPHIAEIQRLQEPDVIWKYFDLKPLFETVKECFVLLLVCRELHAAADTTADLDKMSLGMEMKIRSGAGEESGPFDQDTAANLIV
ncbi:hypothetical protein F2P79_020807 [Pimephales promelas]|nr:hypothetical protein F2P79_020807 [Pimephales promelas]